MRGMWLAEDLSAFQEGLCPVEWITEWVNSISALLEIFEATKKLWVSTQKGAIKAKITIKTAQVKQDLTYKLPFLLQPVRFFIHSVSNLHSYAFHTRNTDI